MVKIINEANLERVKSMYDLIRRLVLDTEFWGKARDKNQVYNVVKAATIASLEKWGKKSYENMVNIGEDTITEYRIEDSALGKIVNRAAEPVKIYMSQVQPWHTSKMAWKDLVDHLIKMDFDRAFNSLWNQYFAGTMGGKVTPPPPKKTGIFSKMFGESRIHSSLVFQDMQISIEVPAGSYRHGKGKDGKPWEQKIDANYGYIKGTHSPDGEHLDCYLRRNPTKNAKVYVVHQMTVDGTKFDEDKVMLGYPNSAEAIRSFKNNTFKPKTMFGGMTEFTLAHFLLAAYQASNSKVILTDEDTYEQFAKKGYLPRGIKSSLQVARIVHESMDNLYETLAQDAVHHDVLEALKLAGYNGRVPDDINETISEAFVAFMKSGLQENNYMDDDNFKEEAYKIILSDLEEDMSEDTMPMIKYASEIEAKLAMLFIRKHLPFEAKRHMNDVYFTTSEDMEQFIELASREGDKSLLGDLDAAHYEDKAEQEDLNEGESDDAIADLTRELMSTDDTSGLIQDIALEYNLSPAKLKSDFEQKHGPIDQYKATQIARKERDRHFDQQDAARRGPEASTPKVRQSSRVPRTPEEQAAARTEARDRAMAKLNKMTDALSDAISNTFPDGDYIDLVPAIFRKFGISDDDGWGKVWPKLEKNFLRRVGAKSIEAYLADMYDDYAADNNIADPNPFRESIESTITEGYAVVLHIQLMENVGSSFAPMWTSRSSSRLLQGNFKTFSDAQLFANRVESGEVSISTGPKEQVIGLEVMESVNYLQNHQKLAKEVTEVEEETTDDVFFQQQVMEMRKLAGVKQATVEHKGTPSVHQTRDLLKQFTETHNLNETAVKACQTIQRGLINYPNHPVEKIVEAVNRKFFESEFTTAELIKIVEDHNRCSIEEYAKIVRNK